MPVGIPPHVRERMAKLRQELIDELTHELTVAEVNLEVVQDADARYVLRSLQRAVYLLAKVTLRGDQ